MGPRTRAPRRTTVSRWPTSARSSPGSVPAWRWSAAGSVWPASFRRYGSRTCAKGWPPAVVGLLLVRLAGPAGPALAVPAWLVVLAVAQRRIRACGHARGWYRPERSCGCSPWRSPGSRCSAWHLSYYLDGMGRLLPLLALLDLALLVIALIDCLSVEEFEIRALPRIAWVFIILLFSPVGPIAWFVAGRPDRSARATADPMMYSNSGRAVAPHDDPEFLGRMAARTRKEDEEMLRLWEEDLRKREDKLRKRNDDEPPKP